MASNDAKKRALQRKIAESLMEAAFEDDLEAFEAGFAEASANGITLPIDPRKRLDQNLKPGEREDSLLGEAACGNAVNVMSYLLARDADPNYRGKFNRTPLMRAVNNESVDAVRLLLKHGADPRLLVPQEREEPSVEFPQGRIVFRPWDPKEINGLQCGADVKAILKEWDINVTLKLLAARDQAVSAAMAREAQKQAAETETLVTAVEDLQQEYRDAVTALGVATARREARILEYDTMKCEGKAPDDLAVIDGMIKQSIEEVKQINNKITELSIRLKTAKKSAREKVATAEADDSSCYSTVVVMHALEDVIIYDHDDSLNSSGKPCLLVDRTGNALRFLSYRAVAIIDLGNSHHMHPEQLRLSLIGALRYGKPLLLNLRSTADASLPEAFVAARGKFDAVHAGIFPALIGGRATDPKLYTEWITDAVVEQHPEFHRSQFKAADTQRFRFAFITAEDDVPTRDREVMNKFYSVLITDS